MRLKPMTPLLALLMALAPAETAAPSGRGERSPSEGRGPFAAAFDASVEPRIRRSMEALFDLDYARSRSEMRKLIEEQPSNPLGYLGEAGLLWWQATAEFGLFKDTPALEAVFEKDVDAAVAAAKPLIDSDDPRSRADGYFASGMALGLHGQREIGRGRFLKAYFDGKKAVKHLKKCVKLDPDYHDAYLGLGVFDYQAASLPGVLKIPALIMIRGDAARGIDRIRQAMERGHISQHQAASFLLSIYLDAGDDKRALPLLRMLRESFPTSPYFVFREAVLLHRLGDREASLQDVSSLFERARTERELLGRKQLGLFCGTSGEDCFDAKSMESALAWLDLALAESAKAPWASMLHAYRGASWDILGRRALASADYHKALALPAFGPSHEYARRCLESPCDRKAVVGILKEAARTGEPEPLARRNGPRGDARRTESEELRPEP